MQDSPLVSIVIIAYNEEKYLSFAIESAINQSYENKEIIVVDDGSTDKTLDVANRYIDKIKIISQKNSGGCSSPRNTGLAAAQGKYVTFLDSDDILMPTKLATQVSLLELHPDAAMIINDYCNFDNEKLHLNHFSTCPLLTRKFEQCDSETLYFAAGTATEVLIEENFAIAVAPMFKTKVVQELGGYSTKLLSCEDFHLHYRVAMRWPIVVNNEIVFHRRIHGSNMSSNGLKMSYYYALSRLDLMRLEHSKYCKAALKKRVAGYLKSLIKNSIRNRNLPFFFKGMKVFYLYIKANGQIAK